MKPTPPEILPWKNLPALPDAKGFAGSFAGVSAGALLVAGGANFPGRPPWEGGVKTWHDRIFVLEQPTASWHPAGHLPRPSAYGLSFSTTGGVVMVGGGDATRNFADVSLAQWDGVAVKFTALPALPAPLALAAGALVDRTVYVAGGLDRPDAKEARRIFLSLDLDQPAAGWRTLDPWPGAERFLAAGAACDGAFYLFGGARLVPDAHGQPRRDWLRDAWRYAPGAGWTRLADLPRPVVAAPSPAPVIGGKILLLGGDDGAQIDTPPAQHRGFPRAVLAYDVRADRWAETGPVPFSLVTTPAVIWRGLIVIPGGEARPGIRSPAVWAAEPADAAPAPKASD